MYNVLYIITLMHNEEEKPMAFLKNTSKNISEIMWQFHTKLLTVNC